MQDEKLRIAIEALLELRKLDFEHHSYSYHVRRISNDALREIQREHFLVSPSPAVAEVIGARSL